MITLNLDYNTEKKFNQLLSVMGMKYDTLINSFHNYKIQELKKGINELRRELQNYEIKYKTSSEVFYKKYTNGSYEDESDHTDFMIWAGEYESFLEFTEQLEKLR